MPEYTDEQIKEMLDKAKAEAAAEVEKTKDAQLKGLRLSSEEEIKKAKAALAEAKESTRKELLEKLGIEPNADDGKVSSYSKLQTELEATRKQTEELNAKVLAEQAERLTAQTRSQLLEAGVHKDFLSDALTLFKAQQLETPDLKMEDFLKAKPYFTVSANNQPETKPKGARIFTSGGKGTVPKHTIDLDKALEEGRKSSLYSG